MPLTQEELAAAFNEWMRRYIETPEEFEREFQSITKYLKDAAGGQTPTYGDECAAYLLKIVGELAPK